MFAGTGAVLILAAIYGFFALRFSMGWIDALLALGFLLMATQFFRGRGRKFPAAGAEKEANCI